MGQWMQTAHSALRVAAAVLWRVKDGIPGPKESEFQWICRSCARAGPETQPQACGVIGHPALKEVPL